MKPIKINVGKNAYVTFELKYNDEGSYLELKTTIEKDINNAIKSQFYDSKSGFIKKGKIISSIDGMAGFSNEFLEFTNKLKEELGAISTRVLHIFCWKHNIFSSPDKLDTEVLNIRWEDSGNVKEGEYLKKSYPKGIFRSNPPKIWNGKIDFDDMVSFKAPLHFELCNEGIRIFKSSPRSSLIILVASLETAIKQYISNVVPQANWLLENIASPPITKLYSSYLETLPSKNSNISKCVRLTKNSLKVIEKAIVLRNKIVHGQDIELTEEVMESIKIVTLETIYYIDWLRGENWAFNYLSDDIKKQIKAKKN